MSIRSLVWLGFCVAGTASADTIFLSANAGELTRIRDLDGGSTIVETFPLPFNIVSLHKDADNNVFALGNVTPGDARIYSVTGAASGNVSLTEVGAMPRPLFGSARIGDDIFGVARDEFDDINLYSVDATGFPAPGETLIGNTGIVQAENGPGAAGMAYDPTSDMLFGVSAGTDTYFSFDRLTGVATSLASVPFDAEKVGMDWYGGDFYLGSQNGASGRIEIGVIDPLTGSYAPIYDLGPNPVITPGRGSALVVIPEPASLGLLSLASLVWYRRRQH